MAYFTNIESGKHYISLFFSEKSDDSCNGLLFALGNRGVWYTSLLPVLATAMVSASAMEILSWVSFLVLPEKLALHISYFGNWIEISLSLAIFIITTFIVSGSQIHAVKNQDYFRDSTNPCFKIDWQRSVSMFVINVLFAVNGILFTFWVKYSPESGEEYGATNNFGFVLLLFFLTSLPGAIRLAWLFRMRKIQKIIWN